MTNFNFSANGIDFGTYSADSKEAAQELFAADAGYKSWNAMVQQAEENGGNNIEACELS